MSVRLLILSRDEVFARMLELEFSDRDRGVCALPSWDGAPDAETVLLDLDTVPTPKGVRPYRLIGFTVSGDVARLDPDRCCSMILRRPFSMALLRDEILSARTAVAGTAENRTHRGLSVDLASGILSDGRERVSLSPKEAAVMHVLLENTGKTVSRREIACRIGESSANKTDVYICYLRRKTAGFGERGIIRTVRGKGYRIG